MGMPSRRDPDALPPGSFFEAVGGLAYFVLSGLGKGNAVYAIKAGVLTGKQSFSDQRYAHIEPIDMDVILQLY